MMKYLQPFLAVVGCVVLAGCDRGPKSATPSTGENVTAGTTQQVATPARSQTSVAPKPAVEPTPVAPPALPDSTPPVPAATTESVAQLTNQLASSTSVQADPVLGGIVTDLNRAVGVFMEAAPGDDAVSQKLAAAIKALTTVDSVGAMQARQMLVHPRLTPEQRRLAKSVQDYIAAFAVQKEFAEMPGAGNEIAQIVHVMRQGDQTTALQALVRVASKGQLNAAQKGVLGQLLGQGMSSLPSPTP